MTPQTLLAMTPQSLLAMTLQIILISPTSLHNNHLEEYRMVDPERGIAKFDLLQI